MSDEQLKYPQWQIALQDLIHEVHREKINEKADKVKALIFERFQQLDKEGDSEAEWQALKAALTIVQIIMGDQPQDLEED
jgi:hypothetical protein